MSSSISSSNHQYNRLHENPLAKLTEKKKETFLKLYRQAIFYNNAACKQLENGSYKQSVKLFTTAFHLFKKTYQLSSSSSSGDDRNRFESSSNSSSRRQEGGTGTASSSSTPSAVSSMPSVDPFMRRSACPPSLYQRTEEQREMDRDADSTSEEDLVVYSWPIPVPAPASITKQIVTRTRGKKQQQNRIAADPAAEHQDTITELEFYSCFPTLVSFNLALSYHLLGMETKQVAFLRKAICFYESSFRFEKMRCRAQDFVSPFLLIAVLSNLGHIKRITMQMTQAERYFQKLFSILTYLVQVKRVNASEYSAFFNNIAIVLLSRTSAQCARAA